LDPIQFAIKKPVTIIVGVILLTLFGMISIFRLPIQLTPDVDKPEITITTTWEGASPQEIEREIIEEQEDKLKSIQNLKKMTSVSTRGQGDITLEFYIGTDLSRALLDTSEKLRQVPKYPENVDEPIVESGTTAVQRAIAWFILKSNPPREDIATMFDLLNDYVKPILERVPGVSSINIRGGMEREVHVEIDPVRLASRKLTLAEVRDALTRRNINISGGDIEHGKRSYTIRTVGQYETLDSLMKTVIVRDNDRTVYLKDMAKVKFGYKEQELVVRSQAEPTIAINATRESGSNVMEVMAGLKRELKKINANILEPKGLRFEQVYDETEYIQSAIDLVLQNLYVGGTLAIIVLLVFLGNIRSTIIVAFAIPISIIGTFLLMVLFGRNLNVISLAGMAFAVGMVVDNSIVVSENIYRHVQMGKSTFEASLDGAREVWGAVLASTLTTLAVFIPVVFVREEAGQLFKDIAIAISSAVGLSLFVSVLFIPMFASQIEIKEEKNAKKIKRMLKGLHQMAASFQDFVCNLISSINKSFKKRIVTIVGLTGLSIVTSILLLPPMTYLPAGNQNLVVGFLITPPGYSNEEFTSMGKKIEKYLKPYWKAELKSKEAKKLNGPPIQHFFYVSFGQNVFMGLRSKDPRRVKPLEKIIMNATSQIPGVLPFAFQRSLFERGITGGNSIELEISGDDMEEIKKTGLMLMPEITKTLGFPRPDPPNFNLGGAEIEIQLDEERAAEMGMNVQEAGFVVRAMVDGAVIGDFWDGGDKIDLKLISSTGIVKTTDDLEAIPVAVSNGRLVPLSTFARFIRTESPTQINHIEERRAVTLVVSPPSTMELSTAMEKIEKEIIKPMRQNGLISNQIQTTLAGTADKLKTAFEDLKWNFLLAIVITYLLMASLFESFFYPFVIMFSVPLAAVGGIIGLFIVHSITGQQMDVLTMLGFVILIGIVVNNAILIVHQSLNFIRDHQMEPQTAIVESVRTRIRPIFMSTTTSVFAMSPLVLFPGAGSELYRGLGSVVIGGLTVSTIFTLLVVPSLFSLVLSLKEKRSS